ncbi:MAG: MDR family MFS transporter [Dehalococcoidia bacterium]|nr:MDR family MFS transporter [Dehalococcoidia bacterium]
MSSVNAARKPLPQTGPASAPPEQTPARLPRSRLIISLAGIMLSLLLAAMDQTIVSTALPRIVADLQGLEHYAWVVTAYLVASTAVTPVVGKVSDMYGRKPLFIIGIISFLAASALCGLSQSMTQLIIFRGLQGIGAGILMASVFSSIADIFPPRERGKWQGLVAAVFGLAGVVGPAAGGYITDNLTWRWIFYVNIPLGLLALAVVVMGLPYVRGHGRKTIDYPGVAFLILTVVPFLLALSLGGRDLPWSSAQVLGLLGLSVVSFVALLRVESRAAEPIVPLGLFRNSIFVVSIGATLLTAMGMFGSLIFVPLYVQAILGGTPTQAGFILMPMTLSMVVGSVISGQLISRWGRYRLVALSGIAIMSLGMFLLTRLTPGVDFMTVTRDGVLVGFGLGITMPLYVIAVQNAFPHQVLGQVTASLQFFRSIGATVGVAVMGALMVTRFQGELQSRLAGVATARISPEQLARLAQPEALLTTDALGQLTQQIGAGAPGASELAGQLLAVVRNALASSLQDVFLAGFIVTLLSFAITLFLKEIPLRKTHHEAVQTAGDARPGGNGGRS